MIARALKSFGRFWWDFLIGDTPEIAVGALVVLLVAFLARHMGSAAGFLVALTVVLVLVISTIRGRSR